MVFMSDKKKISAAAIERHSPKAASKSHYARLSLKIKILSHTD